MVALFATTWRDALSFIRLFAAAVCVRARARLQLLRATSPQNTNPNYLLRYIGPVCLSIHTYLGFFVVLSHFCCRCAFVSFHFISFFRCVFALLSLISLLFTIFHRIVLHDYTRHRWTHNTHTIVFRCRGSRLYCGYAPHHPQLDSAKNTANDSMG